MPHRAALSRWLDPKQVTTWLMGALLFVGTTAFNTWLRSNDNSRRLDILEKTVEQMAAQQTKVGEGLQALQLQMRDLGGDIKNVDTKLDGLRVVINMQAITKATKGQ